MVLVALLRVATAGLGLGVARALWRRQQTRVTCRDLVILPASSASQDVSGRAVDGAGAGTGNGTRTGTGTGTGGGPVLSAAGTAPVKVQAGADASRSDEAREIDDRSKPAGKRRKGYQRREKGAKKGSKTGSKSEAGGPQGDDEEGDHSAAAGKDESFLLVQGDAELERTSAASTPEETLAWINDTIAKQPVATLYPHIVERARPIIAQWQQRFPPRVWARFIRRERIIKELNEIAPIMAVVLDAVDKLTLAQDEKLSIIDLCSGFGFLAMFLSELLPPEKVRKIVLVDRLWPMTNAELMPHHISWDHIRTPGWPVPLETRKADLKKPNQMAQFHTRVIPPSAGPSMVLGVHLCGTLSVRAIQFFNSTPQCKLFFLKPCCLPGRKFLREPVMDWVIGDHTFNAKDVYYPPKAPNGEPSPTIALLGADANYLGKNKAFCVWADHLFKGVGVSDSAKSLTNIKVQTAHFQNLYILARREGCAEGYMVRQQSRS